MNIEITLKNKLLETLSKMGLLLTLEDIVIERSKDVKHGDYACNVALKYAKTLGKNPRLIAEEISNSIDMDGIDKIEIAGPGFINFFMKKDSLRAVVRKIIESDENYGRGDKKNIKINVEFVSANPTGPLHIGHARGAAIGDCICRLLDYAGYDVTREYYINDAGNQIHNLALSIQARYFEHLGLPFVIPEDGYHGKDIVEIAKDIVDQYGDKFVNDPEAVEKFKKLGIKLELDRIIKDLEYFGVTFDVFSSEIEVRKDNAIEKELETLKPYIDEIDNAKSLRTTEFLDDKDRIIVKSNGDYTYFLPDIVYHLNKLSRGYDKLIDVLGADHHGYINRMKSALMMHGYDKDTLHVELIQMVRILKDNKEIKISKRTGDAYSLRDICEDCGKDASRYFFAMRSASMHLDFDINLALEQSSNNPIYYAHYAHARLCSILDQASDIGIDIEASQATTNSETALLKFMIDFPSEVSKAANEKAPYLITNYIHRLAELVHAFYTECRVIDRNNLEVTKSRLALCKAAQIILRNALNLIGVSAPRHM